MRTALIPIVAAVSVVAMQHVAAATLPTRFRSKTRWARAAWVLVAVQLAIASPRFAVASPGEAPDPSWGEPATDVPTFGNVEEADKQPTPSVTTSAPAIPDASWTSMMGKRVEVTLATGEILMGQLAQDNGGSVTLIDDTRTVRVVSKAQATMLRPLDAAAAPPAAAPGVAPMVGTPVAVSAAPVGMTRDQKVDWELTKGTLAPEARKGRGIVLGGAALTIVGTLLLVPGAVLRIKDSVSRTTSTILMATGGLGLGLGLITLTAGAVRSSKVRRQAEAKHPVTASPAVLGRRGGGLVVSGRF